MMGLRDYTRTLPVSDGVQVGDIPEAFDGRDTFSSCQFSIRNQANWYVVFTLPPPYSICDRCTTTMSSEP